MLNELLVRKKLTLTLGTILQSWHPTLAVKFDKSNINLAVINEFLLPQMLLLIMWIFLVVKYTAFGIFSHR